MFLCMRFLSAALLLVCTNFFTCVRTFSPYQVSRVIYEEASCYTCRTLVDQNNDVVNWAFPFGEANATLFDQSSKACISQNRRILHEYANWTSCNFRSVCSVDFVEYHDRGSIQYEVARRCLEWTRNDGVDLQKGICSPRQKWWHVGSTIMRCACDSHFCNTWTIDSLKEYFYTHATNRALIPALHTNIAAYSAKYDGPVKEEISEGGVVVSETPETLCFKCRANFVYNDDGTFIFSQNPACGLNQMDDFPQLPMDHCKNGLRCGLVIVKPKLDPLDAEYSMERKCITVDQIENNIFTAYVAPFDWLWTERACTDRLQKHVQQDIMACICLYHYCNYWSAESVMRRMRNPTKLLGPARLPPLPSTPAPPRPPSLPAIDITITSATQKVTYPALPSNPNIPFAIEGTTIPAAGLKDIVTANGVSSRKYAESFRQIFLVLLAILHLF